jgi:hypothetical protein
MEERAPPKDNTVTLKKKKKKNISGQKSQIGLDTKTYWLTVSCNVTLTLTLTLTKREEYGGYKYGNLALKSSAGIRLKSDFSGKAQKQFNSYRTVLSLGRALQNNKDAAVYGKSHGEGKIGQGSQMSTWHQDGLADCRSVVN